MSLKEKIPFDYEYAVKHYEKELAGPIKEFEQKMWFDTGLCKIIRKSDSRGHSVWLGKWKLSLYSLAGRIMWQIEDKEGNWASFVGDETSDKCRMGLQARSMTDDEIKVALKEVSALSFAVTKIKPNSRLGLGLG